jgi:molecular chaperone GrpE
MSDCLPAGFPPDRPGVKAPGNLVRLEAKLRVIQQSSSVDDLKDDLENTAGQEADRPADGISSAAEAEFSEVEQAEAAQPEAAPTTQELLTEIAGGVREIAHVSARYHARAQQREGVIDRLQAELDLLRQGERRGLLRPMLTDLCRLRNDLLKQAATLPGDFDAARAADLLRSYAETIQLTLEGNGVIAFAPDSGDAFDPRMHRRVSGEATADQALAGRIAGVQREGYLDLESDSPIAPAEVTVFAPMKGEQ